MRFPGFTDVSEITRAGVYVLVSRGVVIYIGKSKKMLSRVYSHHNLHIAKRGKRDVPWWIADMIPGINFDEVHVKACSLEDLDRIEQEMISLYKPRYNTRLKAGTVKAPIPMVINGVPLYKKPIPLVRRV